MGWVAPNLCSSVAGVPSLGGATGRRSTDFDRRAPKKSALDANPARPGKCVPARRLKAELQRALQQRLELLAGQFAVDVLGFAIMSTASAIVAKSSSRRNARPHNAAPSRHTGFRLRTPLGLPETPSSRLRQESGADAKFARFAGQFDATGREQPLWKRSRRHFRVATNHQGASRGYCGSRPYCESPR